MINYIILPGKQASIFHVKCLHFFIQFSLQETISTKETVFFIVLGFNQKSTLVVIEEIVDKMKERDREERGTGEKVKKQKK